MDPTPWFDDPNRFGAWFGGIVGGVGGGLCGLLGALTGLLAPKGKGRGFIVAGFLFFIAIGLVLLVVGFCALIARQPYAIWFPFLLSGLIFCGVMGGLLPVVLKRYREAEKNVGRMRSG